MDVNPEDKLHSQQVYVCDDALAERQLSCLEILYDFNHTRPSEIKKRTQLMQQLFAEIGDGCYIEPPLHANWGKHTHFGQNVYVNFNLTLVDDTHIYIGNNVMIGPNVTIATAGHPIDPQRRQQVTQFNIPVTIGNNVWIGASCVILPGVSIGDNTVIGAGSIVTKNIPGNVVAMGNPCNVSREINENDKIYFYKDKRY
ncbi:sugar O-acetyltransferase [Photobacterium sp. S4TG1]|uniref:sugar O-acetyltransferase n=1 Tax=Photobacterium sp. S4TG1 TaxID=3114587 RepID=UPI002E18FEF9|nr:sugar O-acetyltransferase [Photobacterium sp. S4TG1]